MKKIYLVNYVDESDNTTGVICATDKELPHAATYDNEYQETKEVIDRWLNITLSQDAKEDPTILSDVADNVIGLGQARIGCYEIFVDETYLY